MGTTTVMRCVGPRTVMIEVAKSLATTAPPHVLLKDTVIAPGLMVPEGKPLPVMVTELPARLELGTVFTASRTSWACAPRGMKNRTAKASAIPQPTLLDTLRVAARKRRRPRLANPIRPVPTKTSDSGSGTGGGGPDPLIAVMMAKSPSVSPAESLIVAEKDGSTVTVLPSISVKVVVLKSPVKTAETAPFKPEGCPTLVEAGVPSQEIPSALRVK